MRACCRHRNPRTRPQCCVGPGGDRSVCHTSTVCRRSAETRTRGRLGEFAHSQERRVAFLGGTARRRESQRSSSLVVPRRRRTTRAQPDAMLLGVRLNRARWATTGNALTACTGCEAEDAAVRHRRDAINIRPASIVLLGPARLADRRAEHHRAHRARRCRAQAASMPAGPAIAAGSRSRSERALTDAEHGASAKCAMVSAKRRSFQVNLHRELISA